MPKKKHPSLPRRRGPSAMTVLGPLFLCACLAVVTVWFCRYRETSRARSQMEAAFLTTQPEGADVSTLSFRKVSSYRTYVDRSYPVLSMRYEMLKEVSGVTRSTLSERFMKKRISTLLEEARREVARLQKEQEPDSNAITVLKEKIRLLSRAARDDADLRDWSLLLQVKMEKARRSLEGVVYSPGYEMRSRVVTPDGKEVVITSYAPFENPKSFISL